MLRETLNKSHLVQKVIYYVRIPLVISFFTVKPVTNWVMCRKQIAWAQFKRRTFHEPNLIAPI